MQRLSHWTEMLRKRPLRAFAYYLPRILLALSTLALMVVAGSTATWSEDGVSLQLSTGRVVAVMPGGPAARAGVEPGDVVVVVDGDPLPGTPLYRDKQAGDVVVFTLRRGDMVFDVPLTLVAPGADGRIWRLIPVVVAAGFWGGGTALLVLRSREKTCRAFFRLTQVAAVALAAGQLSTLNVLWAIHFFVWALAALPPLLTRAYGRLVAPDQPWMRAVSPWLAGTSVAISLPDLVLLVLFGPRAHTVSLWPRWRTVLLLYLGVTLLVLIGGMAYAYFATHRAAARRRLRGVAFAVTMGFLPMVLFSLLPEVIRGVGVGLPFQVTFPFLLLIPFAHVYVVVHYDLRPLDRVINRSLVVFILGLIWGGIYLAGVGIGMQLFRAAPLLYPVVGSLATMGMTLVFTPLRNWIQRGVDRLFYGGWYDYQEAITRVSRSLAGVTSREALGEQLVTPVVMGLRLRGAALYLQSSGESGFTLVAGHGLDLPSKIASIEGVSQHKTIDIALPQDVWRQQGVAWGLSLGRSDSEPVGWLLLGEKREDDFFEDADVKILQTLREQATLAAENVLLFDGLRETARALEVAQQQLLTAREQERRILSWQLHDGPLQDLVALSYDLYNCRSEAWQIAPELGGRLEDIRQETLRIKNILRTVCREMRSDLLDVLGLGAAMHRHVHDFMQENDVVVYLDIPRGRMELPDLLSITLFRIFQEALANAAAHSGEREVWVYLSLNAGAYELRVWDQGRGFVVPERLEVLALRGHFGLMTMRERAASVGAHFEVRAQPGQGTEVRVWGDVDAGDGGSISSLG